MGGTSSTPNVIKEKTVTLSPMILSSDLKVAPELVSRHTMTERSILNSEDVQAHVGCDASDFAPAGQGLH